MDKYDPQLVGQMVRWWRKMGNRIPEGQPRTSQEGEEMARLANSAADAKERARALEDLLSEGVRLYAPVCDSPLCTFVARARAALGESGLCYPFSVDTCDRPGCNCRRDKADADAR